MLLYNPSIFSTSTCKLGSEILAYPPIDTCPTGKEMNIWPIGRNHGLDWSNGSPNVISGFDNLIYEGHTSYCYPNGNLAIYTEGFKVYNGQKLPIRFTAAEGVSNSSTTMSCILAQPRHDSIYYVFHMDHSLTHFSDETQFLFILFIIVIQTS